ncbi:MAG: DUF6338 family protein [Intestinimonas sp.]|jgi:hypothetical protein|nr:DUF6338 family protein [Intestinimonas sp.]
MEAYIALLLLVAPGFITEEIYALLNKDKKQNSQLKETITALILSMVIMLINFIIIAVSFNTSNISDIKLKFSSVRFLAWYTAVTLLISVILGYAWDRLNPLFFRLVNWIRIHESKNEIILEESIWNSVFNDGNKHAILIEKDGKKYAAGYIMKISHSANTREMYLEGVDFLEALPEYFNEIKGIYIDFDKGLKISEYDLSKLHSEK